MLKTKSVWSPIIKKTDGIRILATRFRGRAMPTNRYDVWMPSLGPSERLLKAGQAGLLLWAEFARGYRTELFMDGPHRLARSKYQESRAEIHLATAEEARALGACHLHVSMRGTSGTVSPPFAPPTKSRVAGSDARQPGEHDPLKLTIFSMALTAVSLPVTVMPLLVLMNDPDYLGDRTNGWISNAAVLAVSVVACVVALVAIPLQIFGS